MQLNSQSQHSVLSAIKRAVKTALEIYTERFLSQAGGHGKVKRKKVYKLETNTNRSFLGKQR